LVTGNSGNNTPIAGIGTTSGDYSSDYLLSFSPALAATASTPASALHGVTTALIILLFWLPVLPATSAAPPALAHYAGAIQLCYLSFGHRQQRQQHPHRRHRYNIRGLQL